MFVVFNKLHPSLFHHEPQLVGIHFLFQFVNKAPGPGR